MRPTPLNTVHLKLLHDNEESLGFHPKHFQKAIALIRNPKGKVLILRYEDKPVLPSSFYNKNLEDTQNKIGTRIGTNVELEYVGKLRNGRNDYLVLCGTIDTDTKVQGRWISPNKIPKKLSSFARKVILQYSGKTTLRLAA